MHTHNSSHALVHVCVHIHTHTHTQTYICTHTHSYTYIHTSRHIHMLLLSPPHSHPPRAHTYATLHYTHYGAFTSLSSLYGMLDTILFIALCSCENSCSPPLLILGNHIPVLNIDRKFLHGHFTLVLEAKLGSSNIMCSHWQFPM